MVTSITASYRWSLALGYTQAPKDSRWGLSGASDPLAVRSGRFSTLKGGHHEAPGPHGLRYSDPPGHAARRPGATDSECSDHRVSRTAAVGGRSRAGFPAGP